MKLLECKKTCLYHKKMSIIFSGSPIAEKNPYNTLDSEQEFDTEPAEVVFAQKNKLKRKEIENIVFAGLFFFLFFVIKYFENIVVLTILNI